MNFTKKLIASSVAASFIAASAFTSVAHAEVSAAAGVASTYLWRGSDLGSGTPAVSGDLKYSQSGFYTGIWGSSGDTLAGTEIDLYAGFGQAFGDFKYDLSLWSYNYPTGPGYAPDGETDFTDWSDLGIMLGYGPVAFSAYLPVGKDNSSGDYGYFTLSGSVGQFSALLGMHKDAPPGVVGCPEGDVECTPIHLNLSYAYNSNLTFTISQFVADETDADDMKFVVSYSLPIGE